MLIVEGGIFHNLLNQRSIPPNETHCLTVANATLSFLQLTMDREPQQHKFHNVQLLIKYEGPHCKLKVNDVATPK